MLFDVLMDCAQLRRRVSDHTIFALCAQELTAISNEINKLFTGLSGSSKSVDTFHLEEKIKLFEDHFHNVLLITSREPLAFVLFIASLKVLREEIDKY
jgi:hypothetical protein